MAMDPNITTPTPTTATTTTATTSTTTTAPRAMSSPPHVRPNPQLSKPQSHDPSQPQPFLYPVSSSGRGFIPRGLRPPPSFASDPHAPPPSLPYSHGVRTQLDYLNHITARQQYPHHHHQLGPTASPLFKALPFSPQPHPKAAPRFAVSDTNGYKDTNTRERSRDEQCYVVRGRKVRITEDASLYALCRSWLKNGAHEENQPQQKDVMKTFPKPLPISKVADCMSNKKEEKDNDEHEENEKSVELLPPSDLLERHIKRAKKVRARLSEERLHRITRYRSRLQLLLPPPVEQFRNDTAAGN